MKQLLLLLCSLTLLICSCKHESITKPPDKVLSDEFKCGTIGGKELSASAVSFIQNLEVKGKEYIRKYNAGLIPNDANAVTLPFVVYINFSGEVVTSSSWGNFTAASSGLNATQIALVVALVKEDWSIFNCTVTTDPAVWAAAPAGSRSKCIVSTGLSSRFGAVGGIAFPNSSINPTAYEPCFVLSDNLSYLAYKIKVAISHETGHTLGLLHQINATGCTINGPYLTGYGSPAATAWGPIMGQPYGFGIISWAQGLADLYDVGGCPLIQDNYAVLTATIPYRPDDYRSDFYLLTSLVQVGNTKTGLLLPIDKDQLKCQVGTGTRHITIYAYSIPGVVTELFGMKQWQVKVYNSSRVLIQTINTSDGNVNVPIVSLTGTIFWLEVQQANPSNWQPWGWGSGQWTVTLT